MYGIDGRIVYGDGSEQSLTNLTNKGAAQPLKNVTRFVTEEMTKYGDLNVFTFPIVSVRLIVVEQSSNELARGIEYLELSELLKFETPLTEQGKRIVGFTNEVRRDIMDDIVSISSYLDTRFPIINSMTDAWDSLDVYVSILGCFNALVRHSRRLGITSPELDKSHNANAEDEPLPNVEFSLEDELLDQYIDSIDPTNLARQLEAQAAFEAMLPLAAAAEYLDRTA